MLNEWTAMTLYAARCLFIALTYESPVLTFDERLTQTLCNVSVILAEVSVDWYINCLFYFSVNSVVT